MHRKPAGTGGTVGGRCKSDRMEHKNTFKSEDGTVLEMTIKADCATKEEMHKTVSFIAQSARKFYLQTAEKINSMQKGETAMDEKTKALANDIIEQCQKQGLSFKQMDALLLNLSVNLQSAKKEIAEEIAEETTVKLKPF